ncbi:MULTISPECIES: hypothetical protein [Bacillus cereus group]|uniref:hypothetical protein n=1 Tax=Bacillus cereus group TaxID=86661 RepID=UPI00031F3462|nr:MULTISPECIES: hypothetical protein [Bacillus cereus group]MBR9656189.1 hypothetical protein [Bacillus cereus]MCU4901241.1 hypothetical protein [Bacillus cereus]MCU5315746.1 hypothetical protein [Bacillus cereus]MCU5441705.1 hypothetical protein [Bacillus cereus]MCU5484768.1 hypothetical protein [Bacillus cereus]
MINLSVILSITGIVIMSLARINFKIRAIANKPAWGGLTLPLVLIGIILFFVGMIFAFITHSL